MEGFNNFMRYFFGKGDEVEFKAFSLVHLLPILVMIGIIYLIYRYRKSIPNSKYEKVITMTLAFVAIICEMSYYWRLACVPSLDSNPHEHLPITLCGWSIIFCSFLIVTKSQTLFDISYFWLFSGTIFALITPTVITYTGPTRFRFYQFWGEHTLGYIIIFFMIFVYKMRPNFKSIIKSYAMLAIWTVAATVANEALKEVPNEYNDEIANYLFMAGVEDTESLLNLLPSNFALRVLVMGAIVTLLFGLAYLPWFIMDQKKKKQTIPEEATVAEQTEAAPVNAE